MTSKDFMDFTNNFLKGLITAPPFDYAPDKCYYAAGRDCVVKASILE